MRRILVLLHRWIGLFSALFLFLAGLTGAIIAWEHELDALLNPRLFTALPPQPDAQPLPALRLAEQLEQRDPRLRVQYVQLEREPREAQMLWVEPRLDPQTGQPYELGFDNVALNPYSGEIQGWRMWGELSLRREQLVPFLYRLHHSLYLPEAFGIDFGKWVMGSVALVWTLDCFIALWISFPNRRTWRNSFAFRFQRGPAVLNFDLHRSGGAWSWLPLLVLAITAISMNLEDPLMRPVVSQFSPLAPSALQGRADGSHVSPIGRARVLELARAEAQRRGWTREPGGVFYSEDSAAYGVGFFEADNSHGDGSLGVPWLYFDARDGRFIAGEIPGEGSAGDIFLQAQFPLHSGRLFGVAGRVGISVLGVGIAGLSVTGVVIWARRTRARRRSRVISGACRGEG